MTRARARLWMSVLSLIAAAGPAVAQEEARPAFPALAQLFGQPQQPAFNPGELIVRLNQLEGQVRQLNGQIEQLQFRNQQLEQAMRRMQEDYEFRFQELGGRGGQARPGGAQRAPAAAPPTAPPAAAVPPARRSDVFDPASDPSAPGAPRALGGGPGVVAGVPPVAPQPPDQPVGAPGGRDPGQPLDLTTLASRAASDPTLSGGAGPRAATPDLGAPSPPPARPTPPAAVPTPGAVAPAVPRNVAPGALPPPATQQAALPPSSGSAREDYDRAYSAILRQDFASAEGAFRGFLQSHPRDRLVPNATYWLGESLFQRQRFRDAAEHYLKISTDFPNAQVAPNSLLRLGQSLAALGEREAACATFGEAQRKYPTAPQSVRQNLEQEQRRTRC